MHNRSYCRNIPSIAIHLKVNNAFQRFWMHRLAPSWKYMSACGEETFNLTRRAWQPVQLDVGAVTDISNFVPLTLKSEKNISSSGSLNWSFCCRMRCKRAILCKTRLKMTRRQSFKMFLLKFEIWILKKEITRPL